MFNVDNSDLDKVLPLSGNDNQKAFKILYIIHETKTITINKKKKTWWCISIILSAIGVAGSWKLICHLDDSKKFNKYNIFLY